MNVDLLRRLGKDRWNSDCFYQTSWRPPRIFVVAAIVCWHCHRHRRYYCVSCEWFVRLKSSLCNDSQGERSCEKLWLACHVYISSPRRHLHVTETNHSSIKWDIVEASLLVINDSTSPYDLSSLTLVFFAHREKKFAAVLKEAKGEEGFCRRSEYSELSGRLGTRLKVIEQSLLRGGS